MANENQTGATLRVVGGWVRDKLLGVDCNDIDIAIDMPIEEFSVLVDTRVNSEAAALSEEHEY